jgi:hypothetical protein
VLGLPQGQRLYVMWVRVTNQVEREVEAAIPYSIREDR